MINFDYTIQELVPIRNWSKQYDHEHRGIAIIGESNRWPFEFTVISILDREMCYHNELSLFDLLRLRVGEEKQKFSNFFNDFIGD